MQWSLSSCAAVPASTVPLMVPSVLAALAEGGAPTVLAAGGVLAAGAGALTVTCNEPIDAIDHLTSNLPPHPASQAGCAESLLLTFDVVLSPVAVIAVAADAGASMGPPTCNVCLFSMHRDHLKISLNMTHCAQSAGLHCAATSHRHWNAGHSLGG